MASTGHRTVTCSQLLVPVCVFQSMKYIAMKIRCITAFLAVVVFAVGMVFPLSRHLRSTTVTLIGSSSSNGSARIPGVWESSWITRQHSMSLASAVEYRDGEAEEELYRNMKRCCLAMGMTEETLKNASKDMETVVRNVMDLLHAIWSIVPRHFSRNYSNPCWYSSLKISRDEERKLYFIKHKPTAGALKIAALAHRLLDMKVRSDSKSLFCMPSFFIPGFPKSATSSLAAALNQHPQIAIPRQKEVHWWTRVFLHDLSHDYLRIAVLRYLANYMDASKTISKHEDTITYDGSQSTLWDSNFFLNHKDYCATPAAISKVLPEARFVVVMRNPIARLYSHYLYFCSSHLSSNTTRWPEKVRTNPAGSFHEAVVSKIQQFNECLRLKSLFECVSETRQSGSGCGEVGKHLIVSMYHVHLLKWMQFYPKEQFLFLRMEGMDIDPYDFLSKITNFLGLRPVSRQQAQRWFARKMNVQDNVAENPSKLIMWNKTRRLLEDFYRPHNTMLVNLTADVRFLNWNDSN